MSRAADKIKKAVLKELLSLDYQINIDTLPSTDMSHKTTSPRDEADRIELFECL